MVFAGWNGDVAIGGADHMVDRFGARGGQNQRVILMCTHKGIEGFIVILLGKDKALALFDGESRDSPMRCQIGHHCADSLSEGRAVVLLSR